MSGVEDRLQRGREPRRSAHAAAINRDFLPDGEPAGAGA
jgi:hypothetical protein